MAEVIYSDKDSRSPLRIRVVSPAFWLILISVLFTVIPLMLELALIDFPSISTDRIHK